MLLGQVKVEQERQHGVHLVLVFFFAADSWFPCPAEHDLYGELTLEVKVVLEEVFNDVGCP